MKRHASARWDGTLKSGSGQLTTQSQVLNATGYSFQSRFENAPATNPEELIAAAHAGCFSMAFSLTLEKAGFTSRSIDSTATIDFSQVDGNWTIRSSHITCEAVVPGIDDTRFRELAEDAKNNCPVSRVLNAELSVEARLVTEEKSTVSTSVTQRPQH